MAKMDFSKYGPWAFYAALVASLVLVFFDVSWAVWLLGFFGLVVGFLNIAKKETTNFLIAALVWMVAGGALSSVLVGIPIIDPYVISFLGNVITFVGPAAAVVSIMALYHITKD